MSTSRLSRLQREILRLADDKRQHREAVNTGADLPQSQPFRLTHPTVDLFYAEILVHAFGFPAKRSTGLSGQHFSRAEIGAQRYNAAQASVSRAVRRLEGRGLVTVYSGAYAGWTGLSLTDEAVKTCRCWSKSQPIPSTVDGAS